MPINSENYTELWELIQTPVAKEIKDKEALAGVAQWLKQRPAR